MLLHIEGPWGSYIAERATLFCKKTCKTQNKKVQNLKTQNKTT